MAMAMVYSSSTMLGVDIGYVVYLASFLIFFSSYSLNRVIEMEDDAKQHKSRAKYMEIYYKQLSALSIVAYVIGVVLIATERMDLVPLSFVPLIFVILYTVKLPTNHRFRRIKDITVGKNIGVAVAWTIFVVVLVNSYSSTFSFVPLMVTSFFFIGRIFINTVVFDMRDHEGDRKNNIQTIPVRMGLDKTRSVVMIMNAFLGVFMVLVGVIGIMGPLVYFAAISSIYAAVYMYLLERNENRKNVICDFIVDGEYFAKSAFLFVGTLMV
ncbi:MAG: UbiA family prenyltransferase [Candidatus Aenigmarchaeota archaeon]|nr:UbiA family prenyltransferase [Candidatus Aenigmarchaeota archaeon]